MGLVENGVGFWFAFGRSCVFERNAVCMNSNVPCIHIMLMTK